MVTRKRGFLVVGRRGVRGELEPLGASERKQLLEVLR